MKVITNKKHEDTIDLEDVDFNKHYVVAVFNNVRSRILMQQTSGEISSLGLNKPTEVNYKTWTSLKDYLNFNNGVELHAFNTLHEMLDFVKENTSE